MEIRRLRADEEVVRRYVEELWLPYRRELESRVDGQALADGVDLVAEEVSFRLEHLEREHHRTWIAVDDATDRGQVDGSEAAGRGGAVDAADNGGGTGTFAGFVATDLDAAPPVFDRADRLHIGDVYVREPYRGTGLARRLFDRAARRARELECHEISLDVDVDNERALTLYEKLGFETRRLRMTAGTEDLSR